MIIKTPEVKKQTPSNVKLEKE